MASVVVGGDVFGGQSYLGWVAAKHFLRVVGGFSGGCDVGGIELGGAAR